MSSYLADLTSGTSRDWMKSQGSRFVFTVELRGPDFVLPPNEIVPSGEEMWAAFAAMFDHFLEEAK